MIRAKKIGWQTFYTLYLPKLLLFIYHYFTNFHLLRRSCNTLSGLRFGSFKILTAIAEGREIGALRRFDLGSLQHTLIQQKVVSYLYTSIFLSIYIPMRERGIETKLILYQYYNNDKFLLYFVYITTNYFFPKIVYLSFLILYNN